MATLELITPRDHRGQTGSTELFESEIETSQLDDVQANNPAWRSLNGNTRNDKHAPTACPTRQVPEYIGQPGLDLRV